MTAHLCISTYKSPGQDLLKLELCFVGQDCPRVPAILGATYGCQARRLDLSFNAISSLEGLERFPYLEEIILDNNRLSDDVTWPVLTHLTALSINKNLFCNVVTLLSRLQRSCPQLRYLSLLNNCACPDQLSIASTEHQYRAYRLLVLQYLPKLRFLDSRRVRGREAREARLAGGRLSAVLHCPTHQDASQKEEEAPTRRSSLSFLWASCREPSHDRQVSKSSDNLHCKQMNHSTEIIK